MRLIVRNTHKYLSFFISLQLLLWTISGIYFAFNKIELIRGSQYLIKTPTIIDLSEVTFTIPGSTSISVKKRLDKTIVIAQTSDGETYFDSKGASLEKMTRESVKNIVKDKTTLTPLEIVEISSSERGAEFRGGGLPVYKVKTANDEGELINVYVNIHSGQVLAIRSDQWRIWDLMWGLHIMDWIDRDTIDNLFLKIFSILALISSISGLLLFFKLDFQK